MNISGLVLAFLWFIVPAGVAVAQSEANVFVDDEPMESLEPEVERLILPLMKGTDLSALEPCGQIDSGIYKGEKCDGKWFLFNGRFTPNTPEGEKITVWKITSRKPVSENEIAQSGHYRFWEFLVIHHEKSGYQVINSVIDEPCWENALDLCPYETQFETAQVQVTKSGVLAMWLDTNRKPDKAAESGREFVRLRFDLLRNRWQQTYWASPLASVYSAC